MKLFSKMISDRGKKGFTLVEMLIVIAILVIIMAVAVPNVASYVKRIELMELDDSARSIYMAVQNKMTVMKQAGINLEDLAGRSTYESGYPEIFIEPKIDPANPVPTPDNANYIPPEPRYLRNTKGVDNNLVNLTTIEGQLYNNNYIIEYDATTGRVFGVFYSEESDLSQFPNSYMTLDSRDFETRLHADKLVGYYGGEGQLMNVPTGGEVEKPTNVTDSTLEKLVFMLDPPKVDGVYDKGKYYFEVTITGKDSNNQEHTITIVPYDKDHPEKNYYVQNGQRGTVILDSIAPGCGADKGQWNLPNNHNMSGYTLERDFKGWVYINKEIRNELFKDVGNATDDPDKVSYYNPYLHSVSNWNLGKDYEIDKSGLNPYQYAQYFRIDPGSDIYVKITRYKADDGSLQSLDSSGTYNSYFSSITNSCANIAAGRHLQNLANHVNKELFSSCKLIKDIDFSEDTDDYNSWNSTVTYKGTNEYPYLYNFKPIFSQFVATSNFSQNFYGDNHVIKYLRIDTYNDPRYNYDENVYNNTAFFSTLNNSHIYNLTFDCPVVIGKGDYTGLIFAQATGGTSVENCTVINPIVEGHGNYVGGLFGETQSDGITNLKLYVQEVKDHFDNYEFEYQNRKDPEDILWGDPANDPYQRFYIKGCSENTYAGGLIGHTKGQIMNSCAAIRVVSEGYAGGLVGLAEGNIGKCHVGGHTYRGSFKLQNGKYLVNIDGKKGAGGLAAVLADYKEVDGCYTTCSVSDYGSKGFDTFIGYSNQYNQAKNDAYAIGSLIDPIRNTEDVHGSRWSGNSATAFCANLDELMNRSYNNCDASPYDETLGNTYPYDTGASGIKPHLGDWPVSQSDFEGWGMFYWEKEENEYSIKAVYYDKEGNFKNDISTICTTMDGKGISDHGYGYFYGKDITLSSTDITTLVNKTDDLYKDIGTALSQAGLRGVEYEVIRTDEAHGDKPATFTGSYTGGATINQTLYYNPDFCALSNSSLDNYEIRSFKQLENLSNNSSYWDDMFELSHDILFENGNSLTPIGAISKPFTGNFDGHCYRIVNAKLNADGKDSAGIFGVIDGATINGVVVFNADYTGITLSSDAALGGVVGRANGSSSITNCAFTGKIEASSTGSIAAGGIVGIADGDITLNNCQAVMSDDNIDEADMAVNGESLVAAGGIAGMYYSTNPLQNCYSGGYITASAPDHIFGRLIYVGGIIGTNASDTSTISIEQCYTYYQTDIGDTYYSSPHPIASERKGNSGTIIYSNCYYLGGNWYNIYQDETPGVTKCDDTDGLESNTNPFYGQGFGKTYNGYSINLVTPFEYMLPAAISEGGVFYHYGKSPDDTMVSLGDKRFGVFYWEEEAGNYHLKICYYNEDGNGGYEYAGQSDNLCKDKDGNAITRYGYGYFIGNGVISDEVIGFSGSEVKIDDITSVLVGLLGDITADKARNSFIVKCYDCTESTDVSEHKVSIKLEKGIVTDYDFYIVPGLCYVDKDQGVDKEEDKYYELRTAQHLRNLPAVSYKNDKFKQTHDIIYTGVAMAPVGNSADPFTGEYDGSCYRILNLRVQGTDNVGLFGNTRGATIKNTFVIDGNIASIGASVANMGGIVGSANNTTIYNSIYTGRISASAVAEKTANIGGIAGSCDGSNSGSLTNCEAAADITVSGDGTANVGGIVGIVNYAVNIDSCYSGGSLDLGNIPRATVGGIAGTGIGTLTVKNCYTHMYIPKVESGSAVKVHPIAAEVNMVNCHYIESKHHYANAFDTTGRTGITKHYTFSTIELNPGFPRPTMDNTYRSGLTHAVNDADSYPMPAVVKDGSAYVHYGKWDADIVPLTAPAYGIFYWEKEGEDYMVRVCYVEETSGGNFVIKKADNLCTEMDGKAITDFGYGYFHSDTITLDPIPAINNYKTSYKKADTKDGIQSGIENALKKLGFTGIKFEWNYGVVDDHSNTPVQLIAKQNGTKLTVSDENVYVVFNRDFCYLDIWTGNSGRVPDVIEEKPYEIRNNDQLSNVRYYLSKTFKQTHDILPSGEEGEKDWFKIDPIGTQGSAFSGTYDGNGYRIVNAKIDISEGNFIGLFGYTNGATITGVTMFKADINVDRLIGGLWVYNDRVGAVGGIVGYANNTTIENCAFFGKITAGPGNISIGAKFATGGIAGRYKASTKSIKNCESVANITFNDTAFIAFGYPISAGGIAGIADGKIEYCYSGGTITTDSGDYETATERVGGIVGSGTVEVKNCYSYAAMQIKRGTKNPIGNDYNGDVTINNCFYLNKDNTTYTFDDGVDVVTAKNNIYDLETALKTILSETDTNGYNRYNAKAYTSDLSNEGVYPLAAVVTDNSGQYVHYGKVDDMIKYRVAVKKPIHGKVESSAVTALPGETVTLTIEPERNYSLESLTIGGTPITLVADQTEYTFTMPESNVDVDVKFKWAVRSITIKAVSEEGMLSITSQNYSNLAKPGDTVTFEVSPKTGWKCTDVKVVNDSDNSDVDVTYSPGETTGSFIMPDGDVTVTAVFEKATVGTVVPIVVGDKTFNLTVVFVPDGSGTFSYTNSWGAIAITIKPSPGWKIKSINIVDEMGNSISPTGYDGNGTYWFEMKDRNGTFTVELE